MSVRNFWMEGSIDGRESAVKGGPRNKEGGMTIYVKQREDGGIICPIKVDCSADSEGNLTTTVYHNGVAVCSHSTKR